MLVLLVLGGRDFLKAAGIYTRDRGRPLVILLIISEDKEASLTVDRTGSELGAVDDCPGADREDDPEMRFGRQICDSQGVPCEYHPIIPISRPQGFS